MKIGILGSGTAGQALGRGFAKLDHQVRIGTRDPAKLAAWQAEVGSLATVVTPAEMAEWAELIVVSIHGTAVEKAIGLAGIKNFGGKIVIDASDPLDFSAGRPGLFVGFTDSLGERVQRLLPEAKVVKTFNMVLGDVMVNPALTGGEPDMFMAGDDDEAKSTVRELLQAFGWQGIVDLGDIQNARWLEALSLIWVIHSHRTGKVHHAFKLVNK